jgi:ADP-heptose:LPS heptosyltransferase
MREVASERYTHLIELRGDSWTLLLPFLSGVNLRVDRGTVRISSWFSRLASRRRRPPPHEVETNLSVVATLVGSVSLGTPKVEIFLLAKDRDGAAARLRALGISDGVPLVTIHPGASWRPRAWRPERFAEVARRILERNAAHVVFVGSAEERDIADSIRALLRHERAHFLFDAPLRETAALIERSALFIGNDSGIAHIAAACGTPVIALYGPQDPRRFRPWSDRAVVLHQPVSCFPCDQTVCVRPENPCVNLNSVEEVIRNAETVLGPPVEARSAR